MITIPKQVALRLKYGDANCNACSLKDRPIKAVAVVKHRRTGIIITRCRACINMYGDQYSKIDYFDEPN